MPEAKKKKSGGQRKYGRNASKCDVYRRINRREKNKVRKLVRHIKRKPEDKCAVTALRRVAHDFPQFSRPAREFI